MAGGLAVVSRMRRRFNVADTDAAHLLSSGDWQAPQDPMPRLRCSRCAAVQDGFGTNGRHPWSLGCQVAETLGEDGEPALVRRVKRIEAEVLLGRGDHLRKLLQIGVRTGHQQLGHAAVAVLERVIAGFVLKYTLTALHP